MITRNDVDAWSERLDIWGEYGFTDVSVKGVEAEMDFYRRLQNDTDWAEYKRRLLEEYR